MCNSRDIQPLQNFLHKLGLVTEYRNENSCVGKWLHYVLGLTFLPPNEVGDGFLDLIEDQPDCSKLIKFSDYLIDNSIEENATFPPFIWASLDARTWRITNACESFHSKFNSSFVSSHPNIK